MKNLFGKEKMAYFVGGIALSVLGSALTKNGTMRKIAVNGLAKGMKLQQNAVSCYEGMKEEASDLYAEAQQQSKENAMEEIFE